MDRHSAHVGLTRHRDGVQLHFGRDDFADQGRLVRTLSRERTKDMASDYPLPDAAAHGFAERREFRFGEVARDMIAKARGLFADPDRIAELRGRLDKALGREPTAAPEADRTTDKERGRIAAPMPPRSVSAPAWPNLASRCERMMSGIATGQKTVTVEGQDDE